MISQGNQATALVTRTGEHAERATGFRWNWRAVWHEIVRLIKYGMVGLSNTVVSMAVLNVFFLIWPPTSNVIIVVASTVAYAAGDLNSYWWNKTWTFGGHNNWSTFARFAAVSVACMAINAAVVWGSSGLLLKTLLPAWLLGNAAQISMSISGGLGYVVCRNWVFRHRQAARAAHVAD